MLPRKRFLGVVIDNKLVFKSLLNNICKKLTKNMKINNP